MEFLASEFGGAVAIDGDTIVIGALLDVASDGVTRSGAAHVFVRNGDSWFEQQKLSPDDGAIGDRFGLSVAIDGDTIVVGAPNNDSAGTNSGSAYVFVRSGSTWTQQQQLTDPEGDIFVFFGSSVGVSSNTIAVGARLAEVAGERTGVVHVFGRSGDVWSQQQELVADDGQDLDNLGFSVVIDGDTIVTGAIGDDDRGSSSGSAYVFFRSEGVWTQQQKLLGSNASGTNFGRSVSVDGDIAVAAATGPPAFVFRRSGSTWSPQEKLADSGSSGG